MKTTNASSSVAADAARLQAWAGQFRQFAAQECPQDPLYVALCLVVAETPELLALMAEAPPLQARPNLLLAALHERVLAGVQHGLAAYYPSVGGSRLPDAQLPDLLLDFARAEAPALRAHLRERSTQTNEIGRCAVLWPALQHIARRQGRAELALFDFGCSAGLNLAVDQYRYQYRSAAGPDFSLGAPAGDLRPTVRCEWRSPMPAWLAAEPAEPVWRLDPQHSLGVDLAPVDVRDAQARRWLRACLWPHDRERARRLDLALEQAQARPPALRRCTDGPSGLDALESWLQALPGRLQPLPGRLQPVLFNSWVLAYLDAPGLARHRERVLALMRQRPDLLWLSAELADLAPPGLARPPAASGASGKPSEPATSATLWTLQGWGEQGAPWQQALAWSHAHGHWLDWLA